jgi:uncharacterized protein (TIGR03067 family)
MRPDIVLIFAALLALTEPGVATTSGKLDEETVKKELGRLQGHWVMVGREHMGKKATADELKRVKGVMVIEGDKKTGWSDEMGKKVNVQEVTIKLDPTAKPKTVDKVVTKGIGKGETLLGIYNLDGDQLTICIAVGSKERPTEFAGKSNGHAMVVVYKRVKQ